MSTYFAFHFLWCLGLVNSSLLPPISSLGSRIAMPHRMVSYNVDEKSSSKHFVLFNILKFGLNFYFICVLFVKVSVWLHLGMTVHHVLAASTEARRGHLMLWH